MAITLSAAFLAELSKNVNAPNVIIEVALDSCTVKWGLHTGGFSDVCPILKSVSSLQNKLDIKAGYATRGALTVVITGRDNFRNLIRDEYLKNRRVTRKDGFVASGFAYSDYAATYTGKIKDWSRKGDEFTLTVEDDMWETMKRLPVENATKTQLIDYTGSGAGMNPVDIMTNILLTQLGIDAGYVDSSKFASERDTWISTWKYARVITEPRDAKDYLNELQIETNSFIYHDGEKISFKLFAPPVPGTAIEEWSDDFHILEGSLICRSGYKDAFFNRVVFYYDYDESGNDGEGNFESGIIAVDADSQSPSQWNETTTKVIKSKWIRSYAHSQPSSITGVKIYHVSKNNGAGNGLLSYDNGAKTLAWTPFGSTAGEAVKITKDGKFQIFGSDKTKWVRVVVTYSSLPVSNQSDTITISALSGQAYAETLAVKLLNRYRNPVASVSFSVDLNNVANGSEFIKPTDIKDISTDEAFEKGDSAWASERVMITSVRPDWSRHCVDIEAIETKLYKRYGFIAPAGLPDYGSATAAQRMYGYIGDAGNKVNSGTVDGYFIY